MGDPFSGASWSMGYGIEMAPPPPIRRADGSEIEQPAKERDWWDQTLATSYEAGLADLEVLATSPGGVRFWGATGAHEGRAVSLRLPRFLERRSSEEISDELMVNVEAHALDPALGVWVMESPAKWFRGRRAWALNRPPFTTGDAAFDAYATSWAWDCSMTPDALRAALAPMLPIIRTVLDTQPGAIVTDSGISTWIPFEDVPDRLPALLTVSAELMAPGTAEDPRR